MDGLHLRPVDPIQDAEALSSIYGRYVREAWVSFEVIPPPPEAMQERARAILEQRLPYVVAENNDGGLLGYAYASPYRARAAYQYSVENSIYLAPEAQGRGVAKALMDEVVKRCKDRELKTMIAVVGLDPNVPTDQNQSVRFHLKYGFKSIGVLENIGHKFGQWTGTAVLQLDLSTP